MPERRVPPVRIAQRLSNEISSHAVGDLAAGLSYRFLFAFFPFFIFLAALGGFVSQLSGIDDPSTEIIRRIAGALPGDARSLLTTQLTEILATQHAGVAAAAIAGAVWAASSGMAATMRAMNIAYDVEETRPLWKRTGIALGLTLLGGVLLTVAFVASVAAGSVVNALGLQQAYHGATIVLRIVAPVVLATGAAALLFWAAPDVRLPFRWITPGAALFVATWIVGTLGFGLYVSRLGSYNATYGALGAPVVLMLWFYISAFTMLAGAELNAVLAHEASARREEDSMESTNAAPSPTPHRHGFGTAAAGIAVAALAMWQATSRHSARAGNSRP